MIETTDVPVWMVFMANANQGYAHVKDVDMLDSYYVRYENCLFIPY